MGRNSPASHCKHEAPEWTLVEELSVTEEGEGGFGVTGVK